jgi:hypothetical protein
MDAQDKAKAERDREFILWAVRGNREAAAMLDMLFYVAQLWDDLVDQDKPRPEADINRAFWLLLVELPQNDFYRQFDRELRPVLREGIGCWMEATDLERETGPADLRQALARAYTLRTMCNMLVTTCAYLVGGFEWMREVGRKMSANLSGLDGTFQEYIAEHGG